MSRRAIKRYEEALMAEKSLETTATEADPSSALNTNQNHDDCNVTDDDDEGISASVHTRQSLFALLDDQSSDDDDNENKTEEIRDTQPSGADEDHQEPSVQQQQESQITEEPHMEPSDENQNPQPGQTEKKKRRKKRKGAKKLKQPVDHENDPDWIALIETDTASASVPSGRIPDSYFGESDSDDIREEANKIMSFVENMVLTESGSVQTVDGVCKALQVEMRLLNADAELKKLFGTRVVNLERREEDQSARRRGRPPARPHTRRRVSLVSPRENWWGNAPGFTMTLDEEPTKDDPNGIRYYKYKHEASYARVQDEYRVFVNMHDPNLLVELLNRHPYHVDTLLQLAELYRQMGELDRAAEMIERSLYVLETSWNLSFKPYDGSCRLRFDVVENRSLYVALFRYSQLLTRRGLHRTALEICKLLLNFDPEHDPMGMLMLADSFALLSGEFEWIKDMRKSFHHIPIEYFPNFAASEAIACENIRLGVTGISNRGKKYGKKLTDSNATREDSEEADELLVDALLTFPMLLRPLLNAIQDNSTVWTEHRLFDEAWYGAGYEDYGVLTRMSRVYAERSKLLWNSSQSKEMLLRCARKAGALDTSAGMGLDPLTGRSTSARVHDVKKHERVARCRAMRATAGEWLRKSGLYQNVQIADFTDSTTNLPAELLAGDGADRAVGAAAPREVSMTQSAMEFLQSLLPWREARDAGASDS